MLAQTSHFVEKVGYCLLFPVMMLKTRIHWLRAANQPKSFPQGGCFLSRHDDHGDEDDAEDDYNDDDDDDHGDDDDCLFKMLSNKMLEMMVAGKG